MKVPINQYDVFFLSYDEPNAEKHWALLLDICPWAIRVHGVKGFDAAHRACAEQSTTDWFVTVDADNIVKPEFFNIMVDIDPEKEPNRCYSWNAENMINGLTYGNGGLKLWSKKFVLNMQSHENSSDHRKAIDFCWEDDYKQVYQTFSEVWNNGTPYQAFRVGYREGVKLVLSRGERVRPELWPSELHPYNLRNLRVWSSIGSDVEYGVWAIYGIRLAMAQMLESSYEFVQIRDYDWFDSEWKFFEAGFKVQKTGLKFSWDENKLIAEISELGKKIETRTRIALPFLNVETSRFFKEMNKHVK